MVLLSKYIVEENVLSRYLLLLIYKISNSRLIRDETGKIREVFFYLEGDESWKIRGKVYPINELFLRRYNVMPMSTFVYFCYLHFTVKLTGGYGKCIIATFDSS